MNNVNAVIKLHFVNTRGTFLVPSLIMAGILAVNVAVWAIILATVSDKHSVQDNLNYSGSAAYIFVYLLVFGVQTVARTWPFAQGFGVTRRNFAAGTAIAYIILSVAYAVVLTILAGIESLTNGWGIGGRMFNAVYFGDGAWYSRFFVYLSFALLAFFVGAMFAAIYSRWSGVGIAVTLVAIGLLGAATARASEIASFSNFMATVTFRSSEVVLVVLTVVPAAVSAIVGYLVLRRMPAGN